jgi:outer membrane protein assembly factor BamB
MTPPRSADRIRLTSAVAAIALVAWPIPAGVGLGDPAVSGGLVYAAGEDSRKVYVFDARTGAPRNTLTVVSLTGFDVRSALTVSAGRILVELYQEDRAYALDAGSGAVLCHEVADLCRHACRQGLRR